MIATSGFLTALDCTKFVFGPTSKGRGGYGKRRKRVGERREKKEEGKVGKGRGGKETRNTPSVNSCLYAPVPCCPEQTGSNRRMV